MKIYNYLFYKCYQLAVRSRNFDDMPVIGGVTFVGFCVMFNIFSLVLILERFELIKDFALSRTTGVLFCLIIVMLLVLYYYHNQRYIRINEEMERMEKRKGIALHPLIVVFFYVIISFFLMLLAALFKNGDWIFRDN